MSHVVESAASRKHRRNRRTAIVLLLLVVLLGGAFYYAASYFNRPSSSSASGCPTGAATAAAPAQTFGPAQITVNVYNATTRTGLAATAAKDIKARGYLIGLVTNDPFKKKIEGVGELRFGPNGKPGADLALKLVDGLTPVQDTRPDATVDLVLGNAYKSLAAEPTPTAPAATAAPGPC